MVAQLTRLKGAGADCIILVANAARRASDEVACAYGMDSPGSVALGHIRWQVYGARRTECRSGGFRADLQFFRKTRPGRTSEFLAELKKKYPQIKGPKDVFSPVGTANAYDAMHLLALGIAQAGRPMATRSVRRWRI